MKKLRKIVPILLCMLAFCLLAGCAEQNTNGNDKLIIYDCDGMAVGIPNEVVDELIVETATDGSAQLRVYGRAVKEAFDAAGLGEDEQMGWLFTILRWNEAQYQQHLTEDGSGVDVFAKGENDYYVCLQPTDSTFYPTGNEEDQQRWETLYTSLPEEIKTDCVARNQLQRLSGQ